MSSDLIAISCLTGFVGDAILQILTKKFKLGGETGWGLLEYFKQHGSIEALFIAGGMMTIFYVIFIKLFVKNGLKLNYINLAIYGIVLDLIFRKFMIFPSLKGYYTSLNYFESGLWGAIPMILPLLIFNLVKKGSL